MNPKIPIAAISDEFSPTLETALAVMQEIGMRAVELRTVSGKNLVDLTDAELDRVAGQVEEAGFRVVAIASPLLKCVLPDSPPLDMRFQHDVFASKHTFDDQARLAERAFVIARRLGAKIVRVFSFWRTVRPEECFDGIVRELEKLAGEAARHGLIVGLENEHACNIATAAETKRVLDCLKHPNLQVVWDPANAYVSGENPFPTGYRLLPADRIAHVHAKDCHLEGHTPVWGPLGTRGIDWKGQVAALVEDGYKGYLSLETHWGGPGGDKLEGSRICGWNLRGLASG
jgi:sugar phosphate isomerase/epimerase